MQRRTAAFYALFFLLIAVGSYSILAVIDEPVPTVDNPAYTLQVGDTFTVDGEQYNLTELSAQKNSNGDLVRSGTINATTGNETIELGETTPIVTILVQNGEPKKFNHPIGGKNITLNDKQYAVHYRSNTTVVLSSTPGQFHHQLAQIRSLIERIRGIWAVVVLSSLSAILLMGLSYLPQRG